VPRIPYDMLHSAVYIYRSEDDALNGVRGGATGFLVFLKPKHPDLAFFNLGHFYVVTARHVIGRGARFLRLNTFAGKADAWEIPESAWVPHPAGDDITCAPMIPLEKDIHDVRALNEELFVTEDFVSDGTIGPGDEAFFVGRLANADGGLRNQPSVRFGNLAMSPPVPIRSETGIMQDSFIVEARSIGGYSGSPVFVFSSGYVTKKAEVVHTPTSRIYLLGVDWCHLPDWNQVYDEDHRTPSAPKQYAKGNTGMAGVVPTWKLRELLEEDKLVERRRKDEEELLGKVPTAGVSDSDEGDAPSLSRERFYDDLTKATERLEDESEKGRS
jgi:hypothetical protein